MANNLNKEKKKRIFKKYWKYENAEQYVKRSTKVLALLRLHAKQFTA